MELVATDSLLTDCPVGPSLHLDATKVERFASMLDQLPPVTVFVVDERLILVDGYHRLAAAQQMGRTTVWADVHTGTKAAALRFAIQKAAVDAGISQEQALNAIRRHSRARWGDT